MRSSARFFAFALFTGVLICVATAPLPAQEQPKNSDHSTLGYNEEVVKKLLAASDSDVAFLARVKMMQGHLSAAIHALSKGDLVEARQHITHPSSEIIPDIVSVLKKRNLEDPSPKLNVILDLLKSGTTEKIETALYDAILEMAALEHSIDPSRIVIDRIREDAAVLLLRTAVMEYAEAFNSGKITNIVEYHDGAAFVAEAAAIILDAKYEWSTRSPIAFSRLELSLNELQTAWPSDIPPPKSVIPLAKMLALVSDIDAQIEKIRAN